MKQDNKLYFPANISLKKEWWKGFGYTELRQLMCVLIPTIVLCFVFGIICDINILALIIVVLAVTAVTVTCIQRMDNYISIYNYAKLFFKFKSEQQTFYYKGSAK